MSKKRIRKLEKRIRELERSQNIIMWKYGSMNFAKLCKELPRIIREESKSVGK